MGVLLYVTVCFLLAAFKILSLSLTSDNLIVMYLSVGLFGFILFDILGLPGSGCLSLSPG